MRGVILSLVFTSALMAPLSGCVTTKSELSFGSLHYSKSMTSFQPDVQSLDTVALASVIASNGSMWNSPLLKSAANMLFNLIAR